MMIVPHAPCCSVRDLSCTNTTEAGLTNDAYQCHPSRRCFVVIVLLVRPSLTFIYYPYLIFLQNLYPPIARPPAACNHACLDQFAAFRTNGKLHCTPILSKAAPFLGKQAKRMTGGLAVWEWFCLGWLRWSLFLSFTFQPRRQPNFETYLVSNLKVFK